MDKNNFRVLFIAQYAAPYEGNFIASLRLLADTLITKENSNVAFVFLDKVENQPWWSDFAKKYKTYLIPSPGKECNIAVKKIFNDLEPNIVHTHFDGYDLAALYALNSVKSKALLIWHLHDAYGYLPNPLKSMIIFNGFWRHYGKSMVNNRLWGGGKNVLHLCFAS